MLIELEVPLRLPLGFLGDNNPNNPVHNGMYSPEPAFWGSNIANDVVDPPASAAIFQILPNGTVVANSGILPEPTAGLLCAPGFVALAKRRRRAL